MVIAGKYFSDLGCAYEAADPEIIEDASVRWVKEDIREKLKAQDIAPTEFNVQSVIMGDSRLWERPLDRDFRDNMIASGNDDLDARVAILKENGNFKNVDTAMPVESLDDLEQYRSYRLRISHYLLKTLYVLEAAFYTLRRAGCTNESADFDSLTGNVKSSVLFPPALPEDDNSAKHCTSFTAFLRRPGRSWIGGALK